MYERLYPTFEKDYQFDADKIAEQLSIITGESKEFFFNSQIEDIKKWKEQIDFINKPIPSRGMQKIFHLKGKHYRFETNANKLKAGGYMTSMHLMGNKPHQNISKFLFTIAKPIKITWRGYKDKKIKDFQEYAEDHMEDFKDISMYRAYPVIVFFLTLSKNLTDFMLDYSINQQKKMNSELEKMVQKLTDG